MLLLFICTCVKKPLHLLAMLCLDQSEGSWAKAVESDLLWLAGNCDKLPGCIGVPFFAEWVGFNSQHPAYMKSRSMAVMGSWEVNVAAVALMQMAKGFGPNSSAMNLSPLVCSECGHVAQSA